MRSISPNIMKEGMKKRNKVESVNLGTTHCEGGNDKVSSCAP